MNTSKLPDILKKPLIPQFISPASKLPPIIDLFSCQEDLDDIQNLNYYPVILVSASALEESEKIQNSYQWMYVQGAGDDEESWSKGLTPTIFWKYIDQILENKNDLDIFIPELIRIENEMNDNVKDTDQYENNNTISEKALYNFLGDTGIAIGGWKSGKGNLNQHSFDGIVNCCVEEHSPLPSCKYLHLSIPEGKKGQHQLFQALPKAISWVGNILRQRGTVLIHCAQGKHFYFSLFLF